MNVLIRHRGFIKTGTNQFNNNIVIKPFNQCDKLIIESNNIINQKILRTPSVSPGVTRFGDADVLEDGTVL
jgi:hypothetical protein